MITELPAVSDLTRPTLKVEVAQLRPLALSRLGVALNSVEEHSPDCGAALGGRLSPQDFPTRTLLSQMALFPALARTRRPGRSSGWAGAAAAGHVPSHESDDWTCLTRALA